MDFKQIFQKAIEIRNKYSELEKKKYGKEWTREQIAQGFVGDVGDLMKLLMVKQGIRDIENVDEKIAHELADCLWCVLILANKYDVDLETSFMKTMSKLETRISSEL